MSGVESLVTQVKQPGQDDGNLRNEANSSSKYEKRSCLSRMLCCLGGNDDTSTVATNQVGSSNSAAKQSSQSPYPDRTYQVPPQQQQRPGQNNQAYERNAVASEYDVGNLIRPPSGWLLPPIIPAHRHKKCLVLDLDETLVHSSFKVRFLKYSPVYLYGISIESVLIFHIFVNYFSFPQPINDHDFEITIPLEGAMHTVYVRKRPFVDQFIRHVAKKWEVIIFTASLSKYADPLLDTLDVNRVVQTRLFRESCVMYQGSYVKDLSMLGRKMENAVIIDNAPLSYAFQPENAIPITSWFSEKNDRQLSDLIPFLDQLADQHDVREMLENTKMHFESGGYIPPHENSSVISVQDEDGN